MRLAVAAVLAALAAAPAALAKELSSVIVVGPDGPPLVEPPQVVHRMPGRLRLVAPPAGGYALVFPLMRGVPARPGRWYPRAGVLCSGWRSGIEAGCAAAPGLRGFFGVGVATGLYRGEPARLARLSRRGERLLPYGNEAAAVKLALSQDGVAAAAPAGCVPFRAAWSRGNGPRSFCVAATGLYAAGLRHPLPPATARFLAGR